MATYMIHEDYIDRIRKKAARIQKKCSKYGCDFSFVESGEEFVERAVEGLKVIDRFITVEAEGTARINGCRFVASVDHLPEGNIIRNATELAVPSRYYNCDATCEHCNRIRSRKQTFIVYNEAEDRFVQVGSGCLQDYTGGLNIEVATSFYDMLFELDQSADNYSGTIHNYYETDFILGYAYQIVKRFGYVSSQEFDGGTKGKVIDYYNFFNGRADKFNAYVEDEAVKFNFNKNNSKEIYEQVFAVIKYVSALEDSSEYIHNIKVLAKKQYVTARELGYVVSMISCYNRHLRDEESKAKREEQLKKDMESTHIGNVGDRINVVVKSMDCISSWDNQYGTTFRYKIVDEDGNIYMWDSSNGIEFDKVVSLKGTVKKHDVFRGVNQTWLTRCKVSLRPEEIHWVEKTVAEEAFDRWYDQFS